MGELEVKLEQNRNDQQKLKEEEIRLVKEIGRAKEAEWKFGDVAGYPYYKTVRILLYDNTGRLMWFNAENGKCTFLHPNHKEQARLNLYKKIGNIFDHKRKAQAWIQ